MTVQFRLHYTIFMTLQISVEALTVEKHGLEKQLSEMQEGHDVQVQENNRRYEENLKRVQQQVGGSVSVCHFISLVNLNMVLE